LSRRKHYPEHEGAIGEWSLIRFSSWEVSETTLEDTGRVRIGSSSWSHSPKEKLRDLLEGSRRAS